MVCISPDHRLPSSTHVEQYPLNIGVEQLQFQIFEKLVHSFGHSDAAAHIDFGSTVVVSKDSTPQVEKASTFWTWYTAMFAIAVEFVRWSVFH